MKQKKSRMDLSIIEAVDHLVSVVDLDVQPKPKDPKALLFLLQKKAKWLFEGTKKQTDDKIRSVFLTIHHYLQELSEKSDQNQTKRAHYQQGIQAIIKLSKQAIKKIDDLAPILWKKGSEKKIESFQEVSDLKKFFHQFESFNSQIVQQEESRFLEHLESNPTKGLIEELSVLKEDTCYELLFIRREDGSPFFSHQVLENAKSICEFDLSFLDLVEDSPLKMISIVQDEEACYAAQEIYEETKHSLGPFLKWYKEIEQKNTLSELIFKAAIALIAAKNSENLLRSHRQKSCLKYFHDFYYYLSEITSHQLLLQPKALSLPQEALAVVRNLCGWFFLHPAHHEKADEVLKTLIQKGQLKSIRRHTIFEWFLDSYHHLEDSFRKMPSGPIYRLLEQYESGDFDRGFSSIGQGNIPAVSLEFELNGKKKELVYLPSPTQQKQADRAGVLSEFHLFLKLFPEKKFLLFNLQEQSKTAEARVSALEKESEKLKNLMIVSLPKEGAFYHQEEHYYDQNDAACFLKALYDQIGAAPVSGFSFPKSLSIQEIQQFSYAIIPWIHEKIFSKNKGLTRKNRLDFIEIFYGFLIFKILVELDPDCISFTCKDALDIGALTQIQFFTFLKFFDNRQPLTEEDQDLLVEFGLVPAFMQRGRLVFFKRVERMMSALQIFTQLDALNGSDLELIKKTFKKIQIKILNWTKKAA